MKSFSRISLIIGTVIGSGFASGKEIAVYFSRFGSWSYFFIALSVLLFFLVFNLILKNGETGIQKLEGSKFFLVLSIFISLVFTSSMMAGTIQTMHFGIWGLDVLLICILIGFCIVISQKKVDFLTKLNSFLIPITLVALILCLIKNFALPSQHHFGDFYSGLFFSLLYVVLNTSLSSLVIGRIGGGLSKKQRLAVSGISSLFLGVFLFLINFSILSYEGAVDLSMPLLEISQGRVYVLMRLVVFVGCLTTLFSLVFTSSQSLLRLGVSGLLNVLICVILPFLVSFVGFSIIVSWLYPLCSVLGIFLLFLFYSFKKSSFR